MQPPEVLFGRRGAADLIVENVMAKHHVRQATREERWRILAETISAALSLSTDYEEAGKSLNPPVARMTLYNYVNALKERGLIITTEFRVVKLKKEKL